MAVYLDCRTGLSRVEQALVDAISLAYGWRRPAVADLAALAALPSAPTKDGALCFVTERGECYRFRRYSSNTENLPQVVKPSDLADSANGRWEQCRSTVTKGPAYFRPVHRVQSGYAKQVLLWQGEGGSAEGLDRIFGQTPAFLVRFTSLAVGDRVTAGPYGALYSYDLSFEIWAFSKNYRPQNQALWGSDVESEQNDDADPSAQTNDPGLNRMIGDIHYLFGNGCDLGLSPGVAQVRINGSTSIVHEDLDSREFVASIPLTVQASLSIPDEDLASPFEVWIQGRDVGLGADAQWDEDNHVASGYRFTFGTGVGLSQAPTPGVAYINGTLVSSQPGAHTFTASKDTYRWLMPDGSLWYVETDQGAGQPTGPFGALLLGVTVTDASDIAHDALLCDHVSDSGEPYRVS